ncbi:hypothetical protein PoB_004603600 [Plakobranchus ocellatus]|uniref:Uncharacterized protein n=1 Tax=Plakobranchus ocellatus TaxID=259542 RepID=A0AAV4BKL3_9GAST|nr:hypothetical protein PoB_004603600 [Plakobranchus ocellatus]
MDQPLYALANATQGTKLHIMMGDFHVEQAALKTLGDWLSSSRWARAIAAAGVAFSRVTESFFKASHVTGTRHAYMRLQQPCMFYCARLFTNTPRQIINQRSPLTSGSQKWQAPNSRTGH